MMKSCYYFGWVAQAYPKMINRLRCGRKYCTNTADSSPNSVWSEIPLSRIRNFSIIAHVDHGKSTLADRLLEITGAIKVNSGQHQILDRLQVERERGITVKAQTASLLYKYAGDQYMLNLIDTPGHVDFANEVSRSLSACQGVILLVDANDGVQAQTVANFYLAFGHDLTIIPAINKIDLQNAQPDRVVAELNTLFDIEENEVLKISAKLGTGVNNLLDAVVTRIPSPPVNRSGSFRARVIDSYYDRFRGVLSIIYIHDGSISVGDTIRFWHHPKQTYEVKLLAIMTPNEHPVRTLAAGQIGILAANIRSMKDIVIGDTVVLEQNIKYVDGNVSTGVEPLPNFSPPKPMVFAGIYPFTQNEHADLRAALEKLTLNDSAVSVDVAASPALGQGWRLGFLGLLHLDVFTQRLRQEYGAETILSAPSVTYLVKRRNVKKNEPTELLVNNPALFPDVYQIEETFEPMVLGTIIMPGRYLGAVIGLCMERRGVQKASQHIDNDRILVQFELPLCEVIVDFHDLLKGLTSGYGSFDYEECGMQSSNLLRLDIALNGKRIEELSVIVHATRAQSVARKMVLKLKEIIPRQLVQIAVQAIVNGKVEARETIKAYRKDVTAKLYGGDVTRRKKLLAQQTEGKKRMRLIANVQLHRDTFIDVLKK